MAFTAFFRNSVNTIDTVSIFAVTTLPIEIQTDKVGVSKNQMYHRYGISALTYEVGGETGRSAATAARIFAEELTRFMPERVL